VEIAFLVTGAYGNFIKSKEKNETRQDKFSLILWKYHTNFSSQFLRVNESLKFTKWLD